MKTNIDREKFQRYALVTIVVLLAAVASQQVMAFTQSAFQRDHDAVVRHVNVSFLDDERHVLIEERHALQAEARALAAEARALHREQRHLRGGRCDFSDHPRDARERVHVEIR